MLKLEDLSELLAENREAAKAQVAEFSIGGVHFDFNSRSSIMGVINLSGESWYRESICLSAERAIERGTVLHAQGAEIIDVGAESTLAHAARIEAAAQSKQFLP